MQNRRWSDFAPLPLRLILGFAFAYHGFPKVFSTEGHASFVGMLQGIGMPAAEPLAWAVGILEFFGGIALIAGAFTVFVAALGAIEMAVAAWLVHLPNGFSFMNIIGTENGAPVFGMPGYEVNLLYIAGFLALVLGGAGAWSVDRMRSRVALVGAEAEPPAEHKVPEHAWTGATRVREHEHIAQRTRRQLVI